MDRGAWWATVHGVAKSETPLKRLSTNAIFHCMLIYATFYPFICHWTSWCKFFVVFCFAFFWAVTNLTTVNCQYLLLRKYLVQVRNPWSLRFIRFMVNPPLQLCLTNFIAKNSMCLLRVKKNPCRWGRISDGTWLWRLWVPPLGTVLLLFTSPIFFPFKKFIFKLKDNCFTEFCFLSNLTMNQP